MPKTNPTDNDTTDETTEPFTTLPEPAATTPLPLSYNVLAGLMNQATGNPSSGLFHEYIPTIAEYVAKHYK